MVMIRRRFFIPNTETFRNYNDGKDLHSWNVLFECDFEDGTDEPISTKEQQSFEN